MKRGGVVNTSIAMLSPHDPALYTAKIKMRLEKAMPIGLPIYREAELIQQI